MNLAQRNLTDIQSYIEFLERNGDLMLLLAYLLSRNPEWRHASIQVMSIASTEVMKTQTESLLAQLLPQIRIDATSRVILKPGHSIANKSIDQSSS